MKSINRSGSSVVMLSGGLDSATLAYRAEKQKALAACAFVHYGQPAAAQEWRAAYQIAARLGVRLIDFKVEGLPLSSMADAPCQPGARVVPARNAALISLGVAAAISVGASIVEYGATADDLDGYADCRGAFVSALSSATEVGYGVVVDAPLIGMTKRDVLHLAYDLRVPIAVTWSCYAPLFLGGGPCGGCDACRRREALFA